MLGVSKKELKLHTLFLHFLYLSKINKERRYINRNGKMPAYEDRDKEKQGYKSVYMITLRKFLTGFFCNGEGNSTKLKIIKSRSYDGHDIYPDNGKYEYGSSEICDALVKLSFFDRYLPNRFNTSFSYKNHDFNFTRNGYNRNEARASIKSPPFKITYRWDLETKNQTFAPVALEQYLNYIRNASDNNGITDREVFAALSTKLLTKMRQEGMLRQSERSSSGRTRTESSGTLASVSRKYGVPRTIIQGFLDTFAETKRGAQGLGDPQIFEFVKNTTQDDHPAIRTFEYNDFERLAA